MILASNLLVPLYNCCPSVIFFVKIVVLWKQTKKGFYHFKKFQGSKGSVFKMLLLPQRSRNQASLSQQEENLKLTTASRVICLRHIYNASFVVYNLFITYLTKQSSWYNQFCRTELNTPKTTFYYLNLV